jgi:hypothetical protein
MLNKTKYDQPIQRNPSAAVNRRPKRCHLCKKSFAYDQYVIGLSVSKLILNNAIASKIRKYNKAKRKNK